MIALRPILARTILRWMWTTHTSMRINTNMTVITMSFRKRHMPVFLKLRRPMAKVQTSKQRQMMS
eukprot:12460394-Ditylum_brightwellii.AAC.1